LYWFNWKHYFGSFHCAGDGYSVTYNTGGIVTECPITIDPVTGTGTVPCDFSAATAVASLNSLCADNCYLNIHTSYEANGEVRSNFVGLTALCLIKDYVPEDGVVVVAGDAPDTGVMVASFCATFTATQKSGVTGSNAGGYMTICWNSKKDTLTFSGIFYGIQSTIYGIYVTLTGESSYFGYLSSSGFQSGTPFAFVEENVNDWYLAKLTSLSAYITVDTSDYPDGELEIYIAPADGKTGFPSNEAICRPNVPEIDDTRTLTCWYGIDSSQYEYTCSSGQFCSVYESSGYDYKSCTSVDYCYTCDCGADYEAELPAFGAACCTTDYCNVGSLGVQFCLFSGAGSIPAGLLVSLFVALLMKWFN